MVRGPNQTAAPGLAGYQQGFVEQIPAQVNFAPLAPELLLLAAGGTGHIDDEGRPFPRAALLTHKKNCLSCSSQVKTAVSAAESANEVELVLRNRQLR